MRMTMIMMSSEGLGGGYRGRFEGCLLTWVDAEKDEYTHDDPIPIQILTCTSGVQARRNVTVLICSVFAYSLRTY
jgi:hypothetical protein